MVVVVGSGLSRAARFRFACTLCTRVVAMLMIIFSLVMFVLALSVLGGTGKPRTGGARCSRGFGQRVDRGARVFLPG